MSGTRSADSRSVLKQDATESSPVGSSELYWEPPVYQGPPPPDYESWCDRCGNTKEVESGPFGGYIVVVPCFVCCPRQRRTAWDYLDD